MPEESSTWRGLRFDLGYWHWTVSKEAIISKHGICKWTVVSRTFALLHSFTYNAVEFGGDGIFVCDALWSGRMRSVAQAYRNRGHTIGDPGKACRPQLELIVGALLVLTHKVHRIARCSEHFVAEFTWTYEQRCEIQVRHWPKKQPNEHSESTYRKCWRLGFHHQRHWPRQPKQIFAL